MNFNEHRKTHLHNLDRSFLYTEVLCLLIHMFKDRLICNEKCLQVNWMGVCINIKACH